MAMTRKDFEAVARAVARARADAYRGALPPPAAQAIDAVVEHLVAEFRHINPRFDAVRFEAAARQM